MEYIFWILLGLAVYTYVGYGLLVGFLNKIKGTPSAPTPMTNQALPRIAFVVAAYNEAAYIAQKIENTLAFDYPAHKLDVILITDGSTDATPHIAANYPGVMVMHQPARRGKIAAIARAMQAIEAPIVVFSDANTHVNPNALRLMAAHYQDPTVGGVAGRKAIVNRKQDVAAGAGEGFYWRYESWLKQQDSHLHTVVGAAGELFSVRTALYQPVPANTILDDFMLTLKVVQQGFKVKYEHQAVATETASASVTDELKRKVRIAAGGVQSVVWLWRLLVPFNNPVASFQYISHRVLRWTLTPWAVLMLLPINALLAAQQGGFYSFLLVLQVVFYALAWAGWRGRNQPRRIKAFYIPFYFTFMNLAVFIGIGRFLKGRQSVNWERARRATA